MKTIDTIAMIWCIICAGVIYLLLAALMALTLEDMEKRLPQWLFIMASFLWPITLALAMPALAVVLIVDVIRGIYKISK